MREYRKSCEREYRCRRRLKDDPVSSGYDMAKVFGVSVASFWVATPRQLYRELDRMAADGLIQSRVLHHERRRRGDMRAVRDSVAKRL